MESSIKANLERFNRNIQSLLAEFNALYGDLTDGEELPTTAQCFECGTEVMDLGVPRRCNDC